MTLSKIFIIISTATKILLLMIVTFAMIIVLRNKRIAIRTIFQCRMERLLIKKNVLQNQRIKQTSTAIIPSMSNNPALVTWNLIVWILSWLHISPNILRLLMLKRSIELVIVVIE
uniref:Candidate secreted effector n=1 Tax=Meloidogyne incognita TaxID=6306 RepID=A0A914L7U7_MELIC